MVFDTLGRYEFDTHWIWAYDFDMVLSCLGYGLGYGLDMVLIRFWYAFDTILIWFVKQKGTETAQGQVSILIRFWYDFDTILIWFQWVGFKKRNRNSPGTCFWSIFRRFLWFWYDFDTVLIRYWYGYDMVWIGFWDILDMVPMGWLQITSLTHTKNHNWNRINIISKTVSTS